MDIHNIKNAINNGETYLGIEFGSTRIKAVLINSEHMSIASGSHTWENRFENGFWTYSLEDIWNGLKDCYARLAQHVNEKYGVVLKTVGAMGVSAMMHGYMAFDNGGNLLAPFRTWRNTCTGEASDRLTELFVFNIPQRWSIAHIYQAVLNGERHVPKICYLTTLAGYIHWRLTGQKVLGVGDASGVFPINDETRQYDDNMLKAFDELVADKGFEWKLADILPQILPAGGSAGVLTDEGAKLLDPSGTLKPGIPMCPPEGDAGTGMVATNSVRKRTGNVSAGTSVFMMAVLEKPLSRVYPEIDIVATPSGDPVAMVHCNNFLGDIDAWVKLIAEAAEALGAKFDTDKLYNNLYNVALEGDADGGGLLSFNYISGEHVTGFEQGRPLFMRVPDAKFNLANFMRTHLYSACASLKIGVDILFKENVKLDSITGHGGFFKVPVVGQRLMAALTQAPVSVMPTASEGGPWGMAILAAYMKNKGNETLADYLSRVFASAECRTEKPDPSDIAGFKIFIERYKAGFAVERAAAKALNFKKQERDGKRI
ncbi:MAG: FGGY-family carbohydrate kinase [Christensenellales bacterium]